MAVEVADESLNQSQQQLLEQIGAVEHQFLRDLISKPDRIKKITELADKLEQGVDGDDPRMNFLRRKISEQLQTAQEQFQREQRDTIKDR